MGGSGKTKIPGGPSFFLTTSASPLEKWQWRSLRCLRYRFRSLLAILHGSRSLKRLRALLQSLASQSEREKRRVLYRKNEIRQYRSVSSRRRTASSALRARFAVAPNRSRDRRPYRRGRLSRAVHCE